MLSHGAIFECFVVVTFESKLTRRLSTTADLQRRAQEEASERHRCVRRLLEEMFREVEGDERQGKAAFQRSRREGKRRAADLRSVDAQAGGCAHTVSLISPTLIVCLFASTRRTGRDSIRRWPPTYRRRAQRKAKRRRIRTHRREVCI